MCQKKTLVSFKMKFKKCQILGRFFTKYNFYHWHLSNKSSLKSLFCEINGLNCRLAIIPNQNISRILWNNSLLDKNLMDFVSPNMKFYNW